MIKGAIFQNRCQLCAGWEPDNCLIPSVSFLRTPLSSLPQTPSSFSPLTLHFPFLLPLILSDRAAMKMANIDAVTDFMFTNANKRDGKSGEVKGRGEGGMSEKK